MPRPESCWAGHAVPRRCEDGQYLVEADPPRTWAGSGLLAGVSASCFGAHAFDHGKAAFQRGNAARDGVSDVGQAANGGHQHQHGRNKGGQAAHRHIAYAGRANGGATFTALPQGDASAHGQGDGGERPGSAVSSRREATVASVSRLAQLAAQDAPNGATAGIVGHHAGAPDRWWASTFSSTT